MDRSTRLLPHLCLQRLVMRLPLFAFITKETLRKVEYPTSQKSEQTLQNINKISEKQYKLLNTI